MEHHALNKAHVVQKGIRESAIDRHEYQFQPGHVAQEEGEEERDHTSGLDPNTVEDEPLNPAQQDHTNVQVALAIQRQACIPLNQGFV